MRSTTGLAISSARGAFQPYSFSRRSLGAHDVALRITHCGICHTDLHYWKGDGGWSTTFPLVPGHEIVGEVVDAGDAVEGLRPGDVAAIGTIVDSCRVCGPCTRGLEQHCVEFPTLTFNGLDRVDGSMTKGGYSEEYVADQRFVYRLPDGMDRAAAAPLLCAGITTYSPLRHWNVGPGQTVGVVGIGGLGHLAVKFARALGADVVAFTTSQEKAARARALGADRAVLSGDADQMRDLAGQLSFIIDTVPQDHDLDPYLQALALDGTLCVVGIPERMHLTPLLLTLGRRSVSSSGVGGTIETREMLRFAHEHGVGADVELVNPRDIVDAYARLEKGDVRYRFVMELGETLA